MLVWHLEKYEEKKQNKNLDLSSIGGCGSSFIKIIKEQTKLHN